MKRPLIALAAVLLTAAVASAADPASAPARPWQVVTSPTAADLAAHLADPPGQYGMSLYWGWEGAVTPDLLSSQLDLIKTRGFRNVTIEPGNYLNPKYLSPGWFETMKTGVELAREKGFHVYIVDEGKYPSGFAGGKFSTDRPDLRMQGMIAERTPAPAGQSVAIPSDPNILYVAAIDASTGKSVAFAPGTASWTPPANGTWEIVTVRHDFKTSPTRSVNNPNIGAKDTSASLEDYINQEATRQFIDWTHEGYKKLMGDEFGKTILGFRGDEPDYSITPWLPYTGKLLDDFQQQKGYDLRPYLPSMFSPRRGRGGRGAAAAQMPVPPVTEEEKRARADYFDVWSNLFRDNFFSTLGQWTTANHLGYEIHINHEDNLPQLAQSEGDYFKCFRDITIPGIDTIWHQIWPGLEADFPKLASSAAHLRGDPRCFTESFAAYNPRPTVAQARWILNHELVCGVNSVEIMFYASSGPRPGAPARAARPGAGAASRPGGRRGGPGGGAPAVRRTPPPVFNTPGPGTALGAIDPNPPARLIFADGFPDLAAYINRATYLLSNGRPDARIALYVPFSSMWLSTEDGRTANLSLLAAEKTLLEHQLDFDLFDDQAFNPESPSLTLTSNGLTNKSGGTYTAVLIPSTSVISKTTIDTLRAFASKGGKVIFLGDLPRMINDQTFLHATAPGDLSWATRESGDKAVADPSIPRDVTLAAPSPAVKYLHRRWKDADAYFFFNEGDDAVQSSVTLAGAGAASAWDAETDKITPLTATAGTGGTVTVPLTLQPYQTMFIVVGAPVNAARR